MALQPFRYAVCSLNGQREGRWGCLVKECDRDREPRLLEVRDPRLFDERQERQGRGADEQ